MRTPSGARWSCRGCTDCCRHYELGPVEPALIAALEARDVAALWPPAAEAPWHEPRPDGAWLRRTARGCVFLQPDGRCFLHAAFGAMLKPRFCRQSPLQLVRDPAGIAAVVRPGCAGYPDSRRDGAPLEDALAGAQVSAARFFPEVVEIAPGQSVSLAAWMDLEPVVLAQLRALDAPPLALVAALRSSLGTPSPSDPARLRGATGAMLMAVRAAVMSAPSTAVTAQLLADLDAAGRAQSAGWPSLAADGRSYLNLLLRSHLLVKASAPYGSVAAGVGLWLLMARLAGLSAGDHAGGAALAEPVARWSRLLLNASLHPLMRRAAPALVDLYRFA